MDTETHKEAERRESSSTELTEFFVRRVKTEDGVNAAEAALSSQTVKHNNSCYKRHFQTL